MSSFVRVVIVTMNCPTRLFALVSGRLELPIGRHGDARGRARSPTCQGVAGCCTGRAGCNTSPPLPVPARIGEARSRDEGRRSCSPWWTPTQRAPSCPRGA